MMKYPASLVDGDLYPGKNIAKHRIEKCIGLFWFLFPQETIEKPVYRVRHARSREHRATTAWYEHHEAVLGGLATGLQLANKSFEANAASVTTPPLLPRSRSII
jgi:hypothetical protein